MILTPMLPLSLLLPAVAALLALTVWQLIRHRGTRSALHWAGRVVMVLLVLVLALRPAIPGSPAGSTATGGLEVYFAVDTTSSMAAEDHLDDGSTTRLDGAKRDLAAITTELSGAAFSLVTFDAVALQRVPLTTDASAIASATSALTQEVTRYSAGSSVDSALELLSGILAQAQAERPGVPRVLFYFGDGEQTREEQPESFQGLAPFLSGGAVLGYGSEAGGPMREFSGYALEGQSQSYIRDFTASPPRDAISRIDEDTLRSIAQQLGVGFDLRAPGEGIDAIVSGIAVTQPETTRHPPTPSLEFYWLPAIPLGLLALRELFALIAAVRALPPGARP